MTTFISGFFLSLSLIIAIGSQNAFILKQAIKNQHVFLVCCICAVSDSILISLGVFGFGSIIEQFPGIATFARWGGAAFLFIYSLISFKAALTQTHSLEPEGTVVSHWLKTASICLAFTWLNPHVYLDTVVLLGSISTQYPDDILEFALGAVSASIVFFFSLGYGARLLAPIFRKPMAWKVLDFCVGLSLFVIALSLVL